MSESQSREPQYEECLELARKSGLTTLGLMTNRMWHDDPKRFAFVFSRYKFIAKMLSGLDHVLEVGCGDAFCARIVRQEVKALTATDFDPVFVADANRRMDPAWPFECVTHDLLEKPMDRKFDGVYCVDVFEHIAPADEDRFLGNMAASLRPHGVCIIGSPSIESQAFATPRSKAGHVNCKSAPDLKAVMSRHYHNVFLFSMNDEVVHTGYHKMAQFLFALCCSKVKP